MQSNENNFTYLPDVTIFFFFIFFFNCRCCPVVHYGEAFCTFNVFLLFFFFLSPHEMKEEIETKHFEHTFAVLGTNRAAEPLLTKQVEVCAFHHNLSHGVYRVMSVKFLFRGQSFAICLYVTVVHSPSYRLWVLLFLLPPCF